MPPVDTTTSQAAFPAREKIPSRTLDILRYCHRYIQMHPLNSCLFVFGYYGCTNANFIISPRQQQERKNMFLKEFYKIAPDKDRYLGSKQKL
jgi:hypothetical protein